MVTQLLAALKAIHEAIECLAYNQTTQGPVFTSAPPVVEHVIDEPVQGVTQQTLRICQLPTVQHTSLRNSEYTSRRLK